MPPASKKNCSVILFDLATQSREKAIQTLLKICCNNFFVDSKNLTKLILVNSDTTENSLAARYGGYKHINEITKDVMLYDPKQILSDVEGSKTGQANWLEAVSVGLQSLQEISESVAGIITYQILFITDLASPLPKYDKKILQQIVRDINQIGAFFYIVGPEIEAPFTLKGPEQVESWMQNLEVDSNNENLSIVKEIISKTKNSVVCSYKLGVHLFFSYKNWGGTQPWNVPLGIGTKVQIPAQTMRILNEGMVCKLVLTSGKFGKTVWIDAEDESIEIDRENVKNGIMRHEKFVLMPDNKMFQVQNPRSFNVLCFTKSTNVPEYIMRGEACYCVLPNGTPENDKAMNTLIDCLAKQDKYVIARRVYNNNFVPKIVALVPKPDLNPKCFLLASLPFAEDVRYDYNEKSVELAPKNEIVDEVYKFLDTINIDDERKEKNVPLGIMMMLDSNCQKIINKTADKYLDKSLRLEEVDTDYWEDIADTSATDSLKNIWEERSLKEVAKVEKDADNSDQEDSGFDW